MKKQYDDFSKLIPPEISAKDDEEVAKFLALRIDQLMRSNFESLMSMMYRLDISESKIRKVLSPGNPDPPSLGLAKLIIERQKQRNITKKLYKSDPLPDWMNF